LRLLLAFAALLGVMALSRHRALGRVFADVAPAKNGRLHAGALLGNLVWAGAFGLVLAGMNLCFYEAISRVPLGVAVTVEFCGPLGLTLVTSRRWADAGIGAIAGLGVLLLSREGTGPTDSAGIGFALAAGALWACYVVLSKQVGRRFAALDGLAAAMAVGSAVTLPAGIAAAGGRLWQPSVLALAAAVAVLSSALPYSLELVALRSTSPNAFGVMLSLDPAIAAGSGALLLGQRLTLPQWVALAMVAGANLVSARRQQSGPDAGRHDRNEGHGIGPTGAARPGGDGSHATPGHDGLSHLPRPAGRDRQQGHQQVHSLDQQRLGTSWPLPWRPQATGRRQSAHLF